MIAGAVCCDAERRLSVANGTKLPNSDVSFCAAVGSNPDILQTGQKCDGGK